MSPNVGFGPNSLIADKTGTFGVKWRFFFFGVVYKNCSFNNIILNYVSLAVEFVLYFGLILTTLSFHTQLGDASYNADEDIFPNFYIFYEINKVINTNLMLLILLIYMVIIIALFLVCLFVPSLSIYIRYFLIFQIHSVFYPVVAASVGYCLDFIIELSSSNQFRTIFCFFDLVLFFPYTAVICLLYYIEGNSIISPNIVLAEWFHGYNYFYPLLDALNVLIAVHCGKFNNSVAVTFLSIGSLVTFVIMLNVLIEKPFMNDSTNTYYATKYFLTIFFHICSACIICYPTTSIYFFLQVFPVAASIVFIVIFLLYRRSKRSTERSAKQISNIESFTLESLNTTLHSLRYETQLRSLIKMGFQNGSRFITNYTFVRYALQKYPRSNWLLTYVVFLYGTYWGSDPLAYKFLLHILSLDKFSRTTQFYLFQNVYFFMQSSRTVSPLIARNLDQYRILVLYLVKMHKNFWLSSTKVTFRTFTSGLNNMYAIIKKISIKLNELRVMFPFCPSVLLEHAIYLADFQHNYIDSSDLYQEANQLSTQGIQYISSHLFSNFTVFFIGRQALENKKSQTKYGDSYMFLSMRERHERAGMISKSIVANDKYLETVTKTFSISKQQLPPNFIFFHWMIVCTRVLFVIVIISICVGFATIIMIEENYEDNIITYDHLQSYINQSIQFREDLSEIQFDLILVNDILTDKYDQYVSSEINMSIVYNDSINHLKQSELKLHQFRFYVDTYRSTSGIRYFCCNCSTINCSFNSLYLRIHKYCIIYMQTAYIDEYLRVNLPSIVDNEIVPGISEITVRIYYDRSRELLNNVHNLLKKDSLYLIYLGIGFNVVICLITSILFYLIKRKLFQNVYSIIRTVQPPIIKYIAAHFDRLLSVEEHQLPELTSVRLPFFFSALILIFIILLVFPIHMTILTVKASKYDVKLEPLPPMMVHNEATDFIYFNYAILEYLIQDNSTNYTTQYDGTDLEKLLGPDTFCIHNLFHQSKHNYNAIHINEFVNFRSDLHQVLVGVVICLVIIVFIYFAYSFHVQHSIISSLRCVINFIPPQAAQSNPIFSTVRKGRDISLRVVKQFSNELKNTPDHFDFFCSAFYDESGHVSNIVGDIKKILGITPTNIYQIKVYLVENGINPTIDLDTFFDNPPTSPLHISFEDGRQISLTSFSERMEIFIKDESHNFDAHESERISNYVNQFLDSYRTNSQRVFQEAIVIAFVTNGYDTMQKIIDMTHNFETFIPFDSRNNNVYISIEIRNDDDIHHCFEYIAEVKSSIPNIRGGIDIGGPLIFYDGLRAQIAKSRCIGDCYDRAFILSRIAKTGQIHITKELITRANIDQNDMKFIETPITVTQSMLSTVYKK